MFCTSCGTQNPEGSAFCVVCGKPLMGNQGAYVPPQYSAPVQSYTPPPQYYAPSQPMSPAPGYYRPVTPPSSALMPSPEKQAIFRRSFRSVTGSPLFLTTAIVFTLSFVISIIQMIGMIGELENIMAEMLFRYGGYRYIRYSYREMISTLSSMSTFFMFLALIPTILIMAALWMTYVDGRRPDHLMINTSGLSVIYVVTLIQFIGICILFLLSFIPLLIALLLVGTGMNGSVSGEGWLLIFVVLFVFLIVAAIVVGYYICLLRLLSNAKRSAFSCIPSISGVMAMAVLLFISAACLAIYLVCYFLNPLVLYSSYFGNLLGLAQMVLSPVITVMLGILLVKYRNAMQKLISINDLKNM